MGKQYNQLTWEDRLKLEGMLYSKTKTFTRKEMAQELEVSERTIYYELKRGEYTHRNQDWTEEVRYSPDIADKKYREHLKAKGPDLKIGHDQAYADFLEEKVTKEGYSPEAAIALGKKAGYETTITKTTFYRYIDIGLFVSLTNKELPVKGSRRDKKNKVRRQARASAGKSIEKRPPGIDTREEFGHWEMDSVVGPQGKSSCTLLVLTERKTRNEIIRKLDNHTAEQVVQALDEIEREWGDAFNTVFKTITVDNGSEFADNEGLERSVIKDGNRVDLYYCHAYCSCERGTNEVTNRMIRRKIPKGVNFDDKTPEEIQEIEDWINTYPRGIFQYDSARDRFQQELKSVS